jgi:lipid A 3-O-deacylase
MEQDKIRTFLRSSIGGEGRRRWGLVLALIGLTGRVQAGSLDMNQVSTQSIEPASSPFRVTIVEENPSLVYGRDRHYTNGFKLALTSRQLADDSIWNAPIRLLRGIHVFNPQTAGTDDRLEWTPVAQDIFTAQDHTHKFASPNDRPFAGWLYAGLNWIQNVDDQQLTSFEVQAGIVGPWALGRQVENGFHDIVNIGRVHAWRFQLPGKSFPESNSQGETFLLTPVSTPWCAGVAGSRPIGDRI